MRINTYLHFDGNCEKALNYYAQVLGGKVVMMLHYESAPMTDQPPKEMLKKVMHGRVIIGDNVIMGSDAPPERFKGQSGFAVNIGVDSIEEAERLYQGFGEKGEECMPFGETFWAHRFGMFVDKFGTTWMINCEKKGQV